MITISKSFCNSDSCSGSFVISTNPLELIFIEFCVLKFFKSSYDILEIFELLFNFTFS